MLERRSIGGILVHPLALLTGGLAAIPLYLLARRTYTKENARNAINWYLSVLVLAVVAVAMSFLGAEELEHGGETIEWGILPEPLGTIVGLVGIGLVILLVFALIATWIFGIVATVKAIFGTAWTYPFSRPFLGGE